MLTAAVFAPAYADYALFAKPGSLPGGQWLAWASGWLDPLFICLLPALLLVFPTGYPLTPRWQPLAWLLAAIAVLGSTFAAFRPGLIRERGPAGSEPARHRRRRSVLRSPPDS